MKSKAFSINDKHNQILMFSTSNAAVEARPLLDYFDATYVTGHLRQRALPGTLRVQVRRIPSYFRSNNWNVHANTLNTNPRTNNISERWNNKFHALVGHDHPTFWKLIDCLQAESESFCSSASRRTWHPTKEAGKKIYMDPHVRLWNLCEDRVAGRNSVPEPIRVVGHNLRDAQPNM